MIWTGGCAFCGIIAKQTFEKEESSEGRKCPLYFCPIFGRFLMVPGLKGQYELQLIQASRF